MKTFRSRVVKHLTTVTTATIVLPIVTTQATISPPTTTASRPPHHSQNFFITNLVDVIFVGIINVVWYIWTSRNHIRFCNVFEQVSSLKAKVIF